LHHRARVSTRDFARRGGAKPVVEANRQIGESFDRSATLGLNQLGRLAASFVSRAEEDGRAECSGLEHRVHSGGMETTSDVGDVGERVQITEHSVSIDDQDIGARYVVRIDP